MTSEPPAPGVPVRERGPQAGGVYTGLRPVRTLCMLSIVAYHVRWSASEVTDPLLGISFGLTTLQVILCALVARGAREVSAGRFLERRATRLLRPWLTWSLVYLAVKVAQSVRYGHGWDDQLDPSMWLVGGAFHLWFLPYGFAASSAAFGLLYLTRGSRALGGAALAALLGGVTLMVSSSSRAVLDPWLPLDLWLDGLPAVFFGVAIGRALAVQEPRRRRALLLMIAGVSLVPVAVGSAWFPWSQLWARYAVAVPLALLGFQWRAPSTKVLTWLAERNMGVYVVHILVLQAVDRVSVLQGGPDGLRILAVYSGSLAVVVGLNAGKRALWGGVRRPRRAQRAGKAIRAS